MLHLEILDQSRIQLLKEISSFDFIHNFYMAGGTALSLQKGYRMSMDFDFFALIFLTRK